MLSLKADHFMLKVGCFVISSFDDRLSQSLFLSLSTSLMFSSLNCCSSIRVHFSWRGLHASFLFMGDILCGFNNINYFSISFEKYICVSITL